MQPSRWKGGRTSEGAIGTSGNGTTTTPDCSVAHPRRHAGCALIRDDYAEEGCPVSLYTIRAMASELRARGRNYRHVAILRRHVRERYGRVIRVRPSVLIGDVLNVIEHVPWARVTILLALVLLAARR
jgi:hypothetical protein